MDFTRNIKRYLRGDDVKAVKDRLVELGYLHASTHNKFGNDSYKAVMAFQSANGLDIDGVVGVLTWTALFPSDPATSAPVGAVAVPSHIGAAAAAAIGPALAQVSDVRRAICLEALNHAIDPYSPPEDLRSFYIRGGNLYNKRTLALNLMTADKLDGYFRNADYAPYYDGGREEMMRESAERSGYTITGADCSGGIVGLWLNAKVQKKGFDANANKLYGSYCVTTKKPISGDLAWRSGHIGLVLGGGYACEWIGGAYGCQITKISDRRALNYVDGKLHKFSAWTAFGDPKNY